MLRLTVIVDPAATVGVDFRDHIVDVCLCQVVSKFLQNPPTSIRLIIVILQIIKLLSYTELRHSVIA